MKTQSFQWQSNQLSSHLKAFSVLFSSIHFDWSFQQGNAFIFSMIALSLCVLLGALGMLSGVCEIESFLFWPFNSLGRGIPC